MGPMVAAGMFVERLAAEGMLERAASVRVHLYGSLSATGRGHGTDRAVVMGLMGEAPHSVDPDAIVPAMERVQGSGGLTLGGRRPVAFAMERDLVFHEQSLPCHPNGMRFEVCGEDGAQLCSAVYYSVGGGFVVDEAAASSGDWQDDGAALPFDFDSAAEMLQMCTAQGMDVAALVLANERALRPPEETRGRLVEIWRAMDACIERGFVQEGVLPGGLEVARRAPGLHRSMCEASGDNLISSTLRAMDWVNLFALAVNEENAAGGRMVTAPTNGAAGIVPAVLRYYMQFQDGASEEDAVPFLAAAAAIGILCKKNASISGAEVGCQGEVGSACAMAAAGLAQLLGATPEQLENAAEIALEHNLGLTCDPVMGLVQIPCIERNAIAAVKAINAAQLALRGDGRHHVSLDKAIKTMRDTGRDMMSKYKETAAGGLAVNVIEC